jgi:hypothetical protein
MNFTKKRKIIYLCLLILLNIILRIQVVPNEIGVDSFETHVMANSIIEYGYAKWIINPLSFFGLYPASYTSSVHFLISGISLSTGLEINSIIFLYSIFIGVFSLFTAYLMAGELINNEIFKLIAAFSISLSPAVLGYTTMTIPTRPLLIVLAPLLIYVLLKCRMSKKYIFLTFLLSLFLFATHHLFYFILPIFFVFIIIIAYQKYENHFKIFKFPEQFIPISILGGFLFMFSIPFVQGRFMEGSTRYAPIYLDYIRYSGILILIAIGGLNYLILKKNKIFGDWFLLLSIMFITPFIYEQTYMKWFFPIFILFLASYGLMNILLSSKKGKYIVSILILLSICFSGYYQFLHFEDDFSKRYIEDSALNTGYWLKQNVNDSAISNDEYFGYRIFAASDTTHLLIPSLISNQIYGFIKINLSQFKRYPLSNEEFWFSGYKGGPDRETLWEDVNMLRISPNNFNIKYVVENTRYYGNMGWGHGYGIQSKILHSGYDNGILVYDSKKTKVWKLAEIKV